MSVISEALHELNTKKTMNEDSNRDNFYECDFHWDAIDGATFTLTAKNGKVVRVFLVDDNNKIYAESEYGDAKEIDTVSDLYDALNTAYKHITK